MIEENAASLYTCDQCGHRWSGYLPVGQIPARCAKCLTLAWNRKKLKPGRPKRPDIVVSRTIEKKVQKREPKPKKNKWENRYCPKHHLMGCEVCE
jgi:DNA-directed RNA polymerase subunit M/transcription elongation factor TFIIS